jgi:hypothetical protein
MVPDRLGPVDSFALAQVFEGFARTGDLFSDRADIRKSMQVIHAR